MPTAELRWTAQMVRELPDDGNRYEVVDGMLLVTPAPISRHQVACKEFFVVLHDYLRLHGRGNTILWSPADISWTPDTLVQPDIFVIEPQDFSADWATFKHLVLAIEVLSPSTKRADRFIKRAAYLRHGVKTYWIVDPDGKTVEVWHPSDTAAHVAKDALEWQVTENAPLLRIELPAVFAKLPA